MINQVPVKTQSNEICRRSAYNYRNNIFAIRSATTAKQQTSQIFNISRPRPTPSVIPFLFPNRMETYRIKWHGGEKARWKTSTSLSIIRIARRWRQSGELFRLSKGKRNFRSTSFIVWMDLLRSHEFQPGSWSWINRLEFHKVPMMMIHRKMLLWRSSRGELRSKNRHRKSANVFACPSTSFLSPYVAPKLSL